MSGESGIYFLARSGDRSINAFSRPITSISRGVPMRPCGFRQIPRQSPDHFFIPYSTGAVRADFDRQAALDWEAFLSLRAAELRPGGRLVVALPSLFTDDGLTGFAPLAPLMDRSPVIRIRLRTCAALQPCACREAGVGTRNGNLSTLRSSVSSWKEFESTS